jgi:hypothetical protein
LLNNQQLINNKLDALTTGANLGAEAVSLKAIMDKLNLMQGFAEKAWEMSRIQKLLNVITTIAVLHNVMMLSRDVAETFGYVASQALQIIGIKDEEGNPLDINSLVGGSIENLVISLVGEDVYSDARESFKKANRMVQIGSSIVWSVRSIADAGLELQQWIGENTGKIGNALKRYGVVGEDAYKWMSPNPRARNRIRDKFQRVYDGAEALEDTASSYAQVTGNILEIGEEFNQIREQKDNFRDEVINATPQEQLENVPVSNEEAISKSASLAPDIPVTDSQQG